MKTLDELAAELYAYGADAAEHALTLIRAVNWDEDLHDDAQRMEAVRVICDAAENAEARRIQTMSLAELIEALPPEVERRIRVFLGTGALPGRVLPGGPGLSGPGGPLDEQTPPVG